MGNHLACISFQSCNVVAAKQSNLIVVVHSAESRVLEFSGQSIQVAELMLEFPGFFISELKEQSSNVRAIPMSADNELMPINSKKSGVAYVLLPMNKTQKPVAAQEWASWTQMVINHLSITVTKKQSKSERSRKASNRVAPVDAQEEEKDESEAQSAEEEEEEEENIMKQVKEELSSISSSYSRRHWAPKLQTIIEV